jgi:hypothetical protein
MERHREVWALEAGLVEEILDASWWHCVARHLPPVYTALEPEGLKQVILAFEVSDA